MQLYRLNFRQKYVVVTFLLLVFVVGCVSIKQDESNQGFMVSINHNQTKNFDAISTASLHWRKGDIIYAANGHIDHMGLIDHSAYALDNNPDIVDSDGIGVIRRHNDIDKWVDQGGWALVEGYYVIKEPSSETGRVVQSNFTIGDIYSAQVEITDVSKVFKRNSPSNAYGSQLVRQAYKYLYDIDLDTDGGWWSWPKDIRKSSRVKAIPEALFVRS